MSIRKKNTDTDFKFSEGFIQEALNGFFAYNSIKYNIDGLYVFDWESDKLLETKSGYIYEFEIKISKADYKNDFKHKKDKHIILAGEEGYGDKYLPRYYEFLEENRKRVSWCEQNFIKSASKNPYYLVGGHKRPNYFYYAVPTDLINVDDIPEYAGLIYVDEYKRLTIKKQAPKLHKEKYSDSDLNLGEKFYYNMVNWKNKCNNTLRESNSWREKFLEEIDSKGQSKNYKEMESTVEEYKTMYNELLESSQKTNSEIQKDLYIQNRMVTLLVREIMKYNPEFNFFEFEEKHFGKNK